MTTTSSERTQLPPPVRSRGFTLVELITVIAIVAVLAALLLPALSAAKAKAQRIACVSKLRQIGLGMAMYVSDYSFYPGLWDWETSRTCFDKLYPYRPLHWTNSAWHCPSYLSRRGEVLFTRPPQEVNTSGSYAYNWRGTVGWRGCPSWMYELKLGLGHFSTNAPSEGEVATPSEMYVVADVRPERSEGAFGITGNLKMEPYAFPDGVEAEPVHPEAYNVLFADGHVSLVKRRDYLYLPRSAQHWNRDNRPHPETWAPTDQWAVQE